MNTYENKKVATQEIIEDIDSILQELDMPCEYEETSNLLEALAKYNTEYDLFDQTFEKEGKVGIKDINGKTIVPALYKGYPELYSYTTKRYEAIPAIDFNDKCGLIESNGSGKALTPFEYDMVLAKENTPFYCCFKKRGDKILCGLLGRQGEILIPCEMDIIYKDRYSTLSFCKDGKYGLLNGDGAYYAPIYDDISINDEGFINIKIGKKWGHMSEDGGFISEINNILHCSYDWEI